MRVVVDGIVFQRNSYGGIARYWTEVLRAIMQAGNEIRCDLIVPRDSVRPAGIPWKYAGRLPAFIATRRADVYHTSYYTRWPSIGVPSVVTAYDLIDASFPMLKPNGDGFLERQFESLRRAAAIIAISNSTRDRIVDLVGIDPACIFVAYPGVPAAFAAKPPSKSEVDKFRHKLTGGDPYLLHVGGRKNYKNFRTILKAFCLAYKRTNRHLVIMGGRHPLSEEEMGLAINAGALHRIHFLPKVDDASLRLAYAGADAMVHASLMEGFGIPVIEALASGTGLILSDIPVYREIADGRAIFVKGSDVSAWCQAMLAPVPVEPAWRDDTLRRFTWDEAAQVHMRTYRYILNK